MVGLRRPRSKPLRYCWLKPERSSTASWVSPFSRRMRAKLRPTSFRISMRPKSAGYILEVYQLQYVYGLDWESGRELPASSEQLIRGRAPDRGCPTPNREVV